MTAIPAFRQTLFFAGLMSSRTQQKPFDAKQAKEIGERVRIILGSESVTSLATRVGISRQWLHGILGGQVPREASVATLSSISDTLGCSLEWLLTGKGMPNDQWKEKTTLISRVVPKFDARRKIGLVKVEGGVVLVPNTFLPDLEADGAQWGVLKGENLVVGPLVGPSDEVLVDLNDHKLVNSGLFLVQVEGDLLAARAVKVTRTWLLSRTENVTPETLVKDPRLLARIRLVWKRV